MLAQAKDSGFTLLEVMVAIAILGISLVLTMQLFTGALSSTVLSRHYTEATFLARHKLEELNLDEQLKSGNQSGNFDGEYEKYSWQAETSPFVLPQPIAAAEDVARPQVIQIKLTVSWEERGRTYKVELVTLDPSIKPAEGI
jgi:general secretion pathway protein I